MAIIITNEEEDIRLTRIEYDYYQITYAKTFEHYAGLRPKFEDWVRQKENQKFIDGML